MEEIAIIVACAKKRAIGKNGKIPWHIPEESAHFKDTTTGSAVIFGRKSFEEIGMPLPGRFNVVVSTTKNFDYLNSGEKQNVPKIKTADSLENAVALCRNAGYSKIFICGGERIYREALEKKLCEKLIISEINENFPCDTSNADAFFPEFSKDEWILEKTEPHNLFTVFYYHRKSTRKS